MTLANANRVKILICALLATGATVLYGQAIGSGVTPARAAPQSLVASSVLASASSPTGGCAVGPAVSFC